MKKNLFVYAAILPIFVACMAYFLPMDKQFLKDLYRNFYNSNHDSAMSLDLGFSHLRNVSLDESNWTVWGNISGLLLKTPKIIFEKFKTVARKKAYQNRSSLKWNNNQTGEKK